MIKKISILIVLFLTQISFAQKSQKVGYIDREYILENVPEYKLAQSKLDTKINKWNILLTKLKSEIDEMKAMLLHERALLTPDLILEREEDISIKEVELIKKQDDYFGVSGDLYTMRKQLVQPVQDLIFNAIQEIAKNKKYDIIFDKASNDMVMLYSNPKYDVSELVLQKIVKGRKKKENAKKKTDNQIAREKKQKEIKNKLEERKTKQELLRERIKKQNEAKAAKREALKKAAADRRAKKIAEAQARHEALKNKGKKKLITADNNKDKSMTNAKVVKDKPEVKVKIDEKPAAKTEKPITKTKEELRSEKIQKLKDRADANRAKRDSLRKIAADKRAKKLAEIEERKRKLEESKNN